jgi:hypothetical protein
MHRKELDNPRYAPGREFLMAVFFRYKKRIRGIMPRILPAAKISLIQRYLPGYCLPGSYARP